MQTRLRDYKEPILSFDHNIVNLGLHNAGRYCGFDTLVPVTQLGFKIQHILTGIRYKNPINTTIGPMGVVMTPQGVIIAEDGEVTGLSIVSNAGNNETRYDLLIMTHNQVNIAGGQVATYSVIQGPSGNPIKPILTDPYHQTAIGVIKIAANVDNVNIVEYTRFKSPDSGDGEDARLSDVNVFKATQILAASNQIYLAPFLTHTVGNVVEHLFDFKNDGNLFKVLPPANAPVMISGIRILETAIQEGARINILANEYVSFAESTNFVAPFGGRGYRPFKINQGLTNANADTSAYDAVVRPTTGEQWELEFVYINTSWFLTKIGGAGQKAAFVKGMIIEFFGNVGLNFDDTGLGINLMAGWQLLNGNLNSPDRRGRTPVMASLNIPALGASDLSLQPLNSYTSIGLGTNMGLSDIKIFQSNLPNYDLVVNDPGHVHSFEKVQTAGNGTTSGFVFGLSQGVVGKATTSSMTGITVNSGGGEADLPIMQPSQATLYVIKL